MENHELLRQRGPLTAPETLLPRVRKTVFRRKVRRITVRSLVLIALVLSLYGYFQPDKRTTQAGITDGYTDLLPSFNTPFLQLDDETDPLATDSLDSYALLEI
jgi:hypothetical protein